jgi:hypothetical protein
MGLVARIDRPIRLWAYRAGVATPALVLGALPILLGLVTGAGVCVVWALFFLLECFSDLGALFAAGHLPAGARVVSHPTRVGCRLVTEGVPRSRA